MATPITWQNVNAPSNDAAMRGMESAQKGITGAFDKFSSVWADGVKINEDVAARGRQASQEEYLNLVQSFKTPEELQAARMSGVLDQRLAALDPRNQAAVRGATEARISSLQTQATAGNTFADAAELRAQRPVEQEIAEARARGDYVEADRLTAGLTINRGKEIETNRNALRTRTTENAVDDLAAVRNPVALADAKALAAAAPEARAQAIIQQRLTGIGLKDQERTAAEQAEDRTIATLASEAGQQAKLTQQAAIAKLAPAATALKFALDANGAPDMAKLDSDDRIKLSAKAGISVAELEATFRGDTLRSTAFTAALRQDPRFKPEALARNAQKIGLSFDSSTDGAAIGNDAAAIRLKQATDQVQEQEASEKNWYAPGAEDSSKAYEELNKAVTARFMDKSYKGNYHVEDLPFVQDVVLKMSTVGVQREDGTFVIPSKKDILGAIDSTKGGWWFDNTRGQAIEEKLGEMLKTDRVSALIIDGEKATKLKRARQVRELLAPPKK